MKFEVKYLDDRAGVPEYDYADVELHGTYTGTEEKRLHEDLKSVIAEQRHIPAQHVKVLQVKKR
ncbi:hypothetical protein QR721_08720 [Aciduricibacillus chroicocephali]|uniref:Uncharacterized protein n=1 Tax=Aciduricibacillus chroicocephali TaxID=3054939 RepID=A0ABY9KSP1_9BACI|nr:hypothetical protein QR721_08720 [Bacillaceae bacterium 44XB]